MKNILDKFERVFNKAPNVTQGLDDAFNSLPEGFFEVDNIVEDIIEKKSMELFICGIKRGDFDIYYEMNLEEARARLSILRHQLNFFTDEISYEIKKQLSIIEKEIKEKERQDKIMNMHDLSKKFGESNELLINFK